MVSLCITIFANLEGASTIFQASDIFGGGTLLGQVSQKYDIKKKSHRENLSRQPSEHPRLVGDDSSKQVP
jgi:hypothetical protein